MRTVDDIVANRNIHNLDQVSQEARAVWIDAFKQSVQALLEHKRTPLTEEQLDKCGDSATKSYQLFIQTVLCKKHQRQVLPESQDEDDPFSEQ